MEEDQTGFCYFVLKAGETKMQEMKSRRAESEMAWKYPCGDGPAAGHVRLTHAGDAEAVQGHSRD